MATGNQMIHQRGLFTAIEEAVASTVILPGHLCEQIAGLLLQPHSTAGGSAEIIVAQEDGLQGKTVSDSYAAAAPVNAYIPVRGSLELMILKAGFAYTTATKLISAGDGTLKPTTGTPLTFIGTPIAALDLSASGAVNTLASVRIW